MAKGTITIPLDPQTARAYESAGPEQTYARDSGFALERRVAGPPKFVSQFIVGATQAPALR